MENFFGHAWIVWLLIAALAGLLELLVPSFTFSFVSLGAVTAGVSSFWLTWPFQMVVFGVSLIGSLLVLRPLLRKRFHVHHTMHSRSQQHLRAHGEVTEAIDVAKGTGRVLVNGEDWAARADSVIVVGQRVEVTGEDGIVLTVKILAEKEV